MASSSLPFGYTQTPTGRKRNFEQMSSSHRDSSPYLPSRWSSEVPSSPDESLPSARPRRQPGFFPGRPPRRHFPALDDIRFPGDGLDYRRPMPSSNRHDAVIDLTEDTPPQAAGNQPTYNADASTSRAARPPRFDRDIIDVEDAATSHEDPTSSQQTIDLTQDDAPATQDTAPRAASPDVEFVSSRQISNPPPTLGSGLADFLSNHAAFNWSHHWLPHDALTILNRESQHHPTARLRRHVQGLDDLRGPVPAENYHHHHHHHHHHHGQSHHRGIRPTTPPPPLLAPNVHIGIGPEDFEVVGFDLGLGGGDGRAWNHQPLRRAMPSPPPSPKEGFTRSPQEDDVLVCPNCGDELGVGNGDLKTQIWIVKGCGHVYCGECAQGRGSAKKKGKEPMGKGKGKASTKTGFTTCVVNGCHKKVSGPKQMLQLFL